MGEAGRGMPTKERAGAPFVSANQEEINVPVSQENEPALYI